MRTSQNLHWGVHQSAQSCDLRRLFWSGTGNQECSGRTDVYGLQNLRASRVSIDGVKPLFAQAAGRVQIHLSDDRMYAMVLHEARYSLTDWPVPDDNGPMFGRMKVIRVNSVYLSRPAIEKLPDTGLSQARLRPAQVPSAVATVI